MKKKCHLKRVRIVLGVLAILPAILVVLFIVHPDYNWSRPDLEMLYLVCGIPIIWVNILIWFTPDILKKMLRIS